MKQAIRGRFAPSPSGRMHLGNLFSALLAWLDVRKLGGEMLLRMEDLDPERCKPAYTLQLADDLRWLGLTWDAGWQEDAPAYCQSRRTEFYTEAFQKLAAKRLLYPCYCRRKELLAASAPHASDGARLYSGRCRGLSKEEKNAFARMGRTPAWRIAVPAEEIAFFDENFGFCRENLETDCGDFILRRSDGVYAYQLAVSEDDGRMGVTRVVRGRDLLSSTARQIWLLRELGYEIPTYSHVPLLCAEDGRRLSKRDGDLDMGALRQRSTPEKIVGGLAYLAGLLDRPEPVSPRELVPLFSWDKVGTEDKCLSRREISFLF